jgi:hypothetical protein
MQSGLREVIPVNPNPEDPDVTFTVEVTGKLSELGVFAGTTLAAYEKWRSVEGDYEPALNGRIDIAVATAFRDQIGERHLFKVDEDELEGAFELYRLLTSFVEQAEEEEPVIVGAV